METDIKREGKTMIRMLSMLLSWTLALTLTGCGGGPATETDPVPPSAEPSAPAVPESPEAPEPQEPPVQTPEEAPETPSAEPAEPVLTVTVGERVFTATLSDTEAASEFAAMLPLTLSMSELNGNEKYAYLDTALTTGAYAPGTIHAGDILLYGDNCAVLFYETFSSSYRYTPLAVLDDPAGLAAAVGSGDVTVTFALES